MGILASPKVKIKIKPVYTYMIHKEAYSGPCRPSGSKQDQAYDIKAGREKFELFKKQLASIKYDGVEFLEPEYFNLFDDFYVTDEMYDKVKKDVGETDAFLAVGPQYVTCELGIRYNKPVLAIGCCYSTDAMARMWDMGKEADGFIDYNEFEEKLPLLRAKKALESTRILSVNKDGVVTSGVMSCIRNVDTLREKYGIQMVYKNSDELLDDVNRLGDDQVSEAREIAKELVANADFCGTNEEDVFRSAKFYLAVKNMMEHYECNAFTIPCFEICATHRLNQEKYVFCLAHSLLKEEGIPAACEGDLNVLMAMIMLMNITDSAPHMGNMHPVISNDGYLSISELTLTQGQLPPDNLKNEKNLVAITHAVPTRYMKGRSKEKMPYGIQAFTTDGWGTTLRYDYTQDKGQTITLVRFAPSGKKLLAVKAEIVESIMYKTIGCSTGMFVRVNDVKDFYKKQKQVGHHFTWVYGDVTETIKELGEMLGIEVLIS